MKFAFQRCNEIAWHTAVYIYKISIAYFVVNIKTVKWKMLNTRQTQCYSNMYKPLPSGHATYLIGDCMYILLILHVLHMSFVQVMVQLKWILEFLVCIHIQFSPIFRFPYYLESNGHLNLLNQVYLRQLILNSHISS